MKAWGVNKQKERKKVLVCILFFVLSLAFGVYYCSQKQGMYEDEVVTYGLSNSHYATWIYDIRDDFKGSDMTDNVLTVEEIRDYLTVQKDERFDLGSAYANQINDVHPPLYYMILNIASSFNIDGFSKWNGLIPNLLIWSLQLIVLYRLGVRTYGDKIISALSMLSFALCSGGLSNLLFIRMYILIGLFALLLTDELLSLKRKESLSVYLLISLTIFLGFFTHYNFAFFAFLICLVFGLYFLFTDFRKALRFALTSFAGVALFLISFPHIFRQMRVGAVGGTVSASSSLSRFFDLGKWLSSIERGWNSIFKDDAVVCVFCVVSVLSVLVYPIFAKAFKKDGKMIKKEILTDGFMVLTACAATVCTISILNPIITGRYFYFLLPVFSYFAGCMSYIVLGLVKKSFSSDLNELIVDAFYAALFILIFYFSYSRLQVRIPKYLYPDYAQFVSIVKEHKASPVIYFSSDEYRGIHDETLQFWIEGNDVFITAEDVLNSKKMKDYLDRFDGDELVLYIDRNFEDPEAMASVFAEKTDYTYKESLFSAPRTFVVLLHK